MTQPLLIIDIVADLVCPYCYLGYLRLQQALDQQTDLYRYELSWQPFELNPQLSDEGEWLQEHLQKKLGLDAVALQQTQAELSAQAQALGVDMHFSDKHRLVNTLKAHRLALWADTYDRQHPLMLALFKAYFADQQDISDHETLLQLVAELELPIDEADALLNSDQFTTEIRAKEQQWHKQGIQSVPTYVINERYAISGALDSDTLAQGFAQLVAAMSNNASA